jgi:heptosyltransferase-2
LSQTEKILIVGPSWVGDMVMAQSLFITLSNNRENCQIDVLAPAWSASFLDRMPEVDKIISMPVGRGRFALFERYSLGKKLASSGYDQAIVLPNSWKSALIPFFAGIPLRTGFIGEMRWGLLNDTRKLNKSVLTMTVQRFVALAFQPSVKLPPECPVPELIVEGKKVKDTIKKFQLGTEKKILALCPGAEYGKSKRWPTENYAAVAKYKLDEGWSVWLFGSEKDKSVTAEINQKTGNKCVDLSGLTSMPEVIDLMSLAKIVVSNDSGLMHVAAALNNKVVAIYGSTDPIFTPPLNDESEVISLGLDCMPCSARECPYGHYQCLTGIHPERVLAAMECLSA